jgi:hypothetical protein
MRNPAPRPTSSRQQHESSVRLLVFYHLQPHAQSLRFFGGSLPGVALLDVGQFHRLSGHLLDGPRHLAHVLSLLLVGRADSQGEQVP